MNGETIFLIFICLLGLAALAAVFLNEYRRTQPLDDGTVWRQAGLTVDRARQTLNWKNVTAPATSVTEVSLGVSLPGVSRRRFSACRIVSSHSELRDLRIPFALHSSAATFAWRLRDVLREAGNTHEQATNKPFRLGRKG